MGQNLTGQTIASTYEDLVQISGSILTDGLGNNINNLTITSSFATTASYAANAAGVPNALFSASFSDPNLIFTKGDASTFNVDLSAIANGTSGTSGISGTNGSSGTAGSSGTSGVVLALAAKNIEISGSDFTYAYLGGNYGISSSYADITFTQPFASTDYSIDFQYNADPGSDLEYDLSSAGATSIVFTNKTASGFRLWFVGLNVPSIYPNLKGYVQAIALGENSQDGTSGTSGLTGTSGTSGQDGTFFGSSGTSGSSGSSGTSGINGSSGTSGSSGSSGTSGVDGSSGTSGIAGSSGTSGINGSSGTSGVDGTNGTSGVSGTDGSSGTSGDGTSGTSGVSGSSGTSGIDGSSGTSGINGSSGTSGVDGTNGTSGFSGTDGSSGTSGLTGTSGTSGQDGTNFGTSGTSGIDGSSGTSGVSLTGTIDVEYTGSSLGAFGTINFTGSGVVVTDVAGTASIEITGGGGGAGFPYTGSAEITGSLILTGSFSQNQGDITFTQISASQNYASDAAAASAGVPLGGLYRNGNFIMIRIQ